MDDRLVLSLFPGIGLLDMAFEEEGFCVVRGPDVLWGGDIKRFHPPAGRFDGVIGGPPCQAFSRLRHIVEANGYKVAENLIPEYERCVSEAVPDWFLMENVPDAPDAQVSGYIVHSFLFNNRWTGAPQNRLRKWCFGSKCGVRIYPEQAALENADYEHAVCASGGYRAVPVAIGGSGKPKRGKRWTQSKYLGYKSRDSAAAAAAAQGLPADFLDRCPLTVEGKQRVLGNGVPLPMGIAIARAVKKALGL